MKYGIEFLDIIQRANQAGPAKHKIKTGYMPILKVWPQSNPKQPAIYEPEMRWTIPTSDTQ